MLMLFHQYFTYITTNPQKTVLYVGMSNTLTQRLIEHYLNRGNPKTFAGLAPPKRLREGAEDFTVTTLFTLNMTSTLIMLLQERKRLKAGAEKRKSSSFRNLIQSGRS